MPDFRELIRQRLRDSGIAPAREAEIVNEMAQHLADRYEVLRSNGASNDESLRALVTELDQRELAAELRRVEPGWSEPATFGAGAAGFWAARWQDVRFGLRILRKSPGFTLVCVLSLALGIGANTAIFQLIDAVLMRKLPVKDPQQLVELRVRHQFRSGSTRGFTKEFSYPQWERVREQQQGFSAAAAWGTAIFDLNTSGESRYAQGLWVSGNFFDVLGIRPAVGRLFSRQDDQPGCASGGAVLSYAFWQREYGGQPSAIGQKLMLDGQAFEIIGVTPPSFFGLLVGQQFDVAVPLCIEPIIDGATFNLHNPTLWFLDVVGRLKPGWTVERASAQLDAISPSVFAATLPPKYDAVDRENYLKFRVYAVPAATGNSPLRKPYETPLWLLLGISGLVLLIACANLANLMMARASLRQREMAVRLALGASRTRLIHQLFTEAMLLAMMGAAGGILLAQGVSRTLVSFLGTRNNQIFLNLQPDWRVLAFTAALATLACLLFGLVPATQAAQTAPAEAMKTGGRGLSAGHVRFGVRRGLVIAQVAISLVLLAGALLFVRTFTNLLTLDAGFQQDHILVTHVVFSALKLPPERFAEYRLALLTRVRAIPGVQDAAENAIIPISGSGWNEDLKVEGTAVQRTTADFNAVTSHYFSTMRTPLLTGRDFSEQDTPNSPRVAIVNETFAKKIYGGANPVGRTFKVLQGAGQPDMEYQVIGLVKDTKYDDLRADFPPIAFVARSQFKDPEADAGLMIRSDLAPEDLIREVRNALTQMNPGLLMQFTVFKTGIREGLARERLMATLAGFFGGLAVLLAVIGLYGVIAYMVARRTNEIGIRMALGAAPQQILAMVVREAASLMGIGLAVGAALALAAGQTAASLLYGLTPHDPGTFVAAVFGLAVVALVASLLPARRAARLEPMAALRQE